MKKVRNEAFFVMLGIAVMLGGACHGADIVINEIAWAGSAANASDEWIELHNVAESTIDLTGWTLFLNEKTIPLSEVRDSTVAVRRTSIEPGGYFLLERTDDETVSDIEADLIYTGALSNAGARLELRDGEGKIVDEVDATENGWPAGTASDTVPTYASMERTDPVSVPPIWETNQGIVRNGLDAEGHPVNGTPGRVNAAVVIAACAPRIDILSPELDETELQGTVTVRWTAADPDGADEALRISIYLSSDGGESWEGMAANLANAGRYAWDTTIHPDGKAYRLKIIVEDDDGYQAGAIGPVFTIRNATG